MVLCFFEGEDGLVAMDVSVSDYLRGHMASSRVMSLCMIDGLVLSSPVTHHYKWMQILTKSMCFIYS